MLPGSTVTSSPSWTTSRSAPRTDSHLQSFLVDELQNFQDQLLSVLPGLITREFTSTPTTPRGCLHICVLEEFSTSRRGTSALPGPTTSREPQLLPHSEEESQPHPAKGLNHFQDHCRLVMSTRPQDFQERSLRRKVERLQRMIEDGLAAPLQPFDVRRMTGAMEDVKTAHGSLDAKILDVLDALQDQVQVRLRWMSTPCGSTSGSTFLTKL